MTRSDLSPYQVSFSLALLRRRPRRGLPGSSAVVLGECPAELARRRLDVWTPSFRVVDLPQVELPYPQREPILIEGRVTTGAVAGYSSTISS